jgi:polysaccharide export outer membrane protein
MRTNFPAFTERPRPAAAGRWTAFALGAVLIAGALGSGCGGHLAYVDPNPENAYVFPGQTPPQPAATPPAPTPGALPPAAGTAPGTFNPAFAVLRLGDLVRVTFADLPQAWPEHQERVHEDGRITLPLNVSVVAAGKTPSQLQEDIRNAYVPSLLKRLTVTVKPEERHYFVGGEVRIPNRQAYFGDMTVLRAIDTCGGFTDFANRKNIELRRATGEKFKINWYDAIKDARKDLAVFPNDQIIVHKKLF